MTFLDAFIYGLVEGLTEFLPVSSTAHLIIVSKLLGNPQTEFLKVFEVVIQFGAILSIIALYGRSLLVRFEIIKRVLTAFIPTAILGFLFHSVIKNVFFENIAVILWALFLGGVFLIIFERNHRESGNGNGLENVPYWAAAGIGFFQALAMVPGVSRSAATIIGGLVFGLKRKETVEFSFLLAVPTMLAASALDLVKCRVSFSAHEWLFLAAGFVVSFIVALGSVKFLLRYIQSNNFIGFGVYRIILAIVFGMLIF